jgi:hypothetical protein
LRRKNLATDVRAALICQPQLVPFLLRP